MSEYEIAIEENSEVLILNLISVKALPSRVDQGGDGFRDVMKERLPVSSKLTTALFT